MLSAWCPSWDKGAKRLLHTVMHEPTTCLAHAKPPGTSRRARSTPALAEQALVLCEPQSLEEFAKLAMRLEDDMAVEFPDWRYGCWNDLPPAIKLRYACLAPSRP